MKQIAMLLIIVIAVPVFADQEVSESKTRRFFKDVAVIAGFTGAAVLINPRIREALQRECTINNIQRNFASPIARVREGTRSDTDHFAINYVAHPASYIAMGLYLKQRGYRKPTAFLFTQAHSVIWEFAIEGSSFPPSGKDLLSNLAGSAAAIFFLQPVSQRAERALKSGRHHWYHHILYWLDPVNAIADQTDGAE